MYNGYEKDWHTNESRTASTQLQNGHLLSENHNTSDIANARDNQTVNGKANALFSMTGKAPVYVLYVQLHQPMADMIGPKPTIPSKPRFGTTISSHNRMSHDH